MKSRSRMKYCQTIWIFGIRRPNFLKWWSSSHNAYHHINAISNPHDLDSSSDVRGSALFQAMSAAACFMISGKWLKRSVEDIPASFIVASPHIWPICGRKVTTCSSSGPLMSNRLLCVCLQPLWRWRETSASSWTVWWALSSLCWPLISASSSPSTAGYQG